MSKIAIISQPDKGVLIDLGGCSSLTEAAHHLTSTLQISSDFWNGVSIDLNLGQLALTPEEVAQIISIAAEVGVKPAQVFTGNSLTLASLKINAIELGQGTPMKLPETVTEAAEPQAQDQILSDVPAERSVDPITATDQPLPPSTEAQSTAEGTPAESSAEPSATSPATAEAESATTDGEAQQAAAPAPPPQPVVLYLRQTLRSGQAVSHKGHLVIIGDVNPGAEVMAEGDITVWGALRGIAHAGIGGNTRAEIRALKLQPVQLRIAHAIARSPDRPRKNFSSSSGPETARILNGMIRISATTPD